MQHASNQLVFKEGILNPAQWTAADENAPFPLQQHPSYGAALISFGAEAQQLIISENNETLALALLIKRRFFGAIRFTTLFRGPVWCQPNISFEKKMQIYSGIQARYSRWKWNFLATMPELPSEDETLSAFQKAGFKRTMTGFSTAWIDLRPDTEALRKTLKGKWRNQLVGAEKAEATENLKISFGGKKEHQYAWLLEKEAEQRDNRRYQATPLGLVPSYLASVTPKSNSGIVSVTALHGRRKVAGALFLLHGNSATYHIGWAGDDGRALNAQNRVLWEAMLELKKRGIKFLDLGGLNTADLAGIARFKLGTGAPPITLIGSFI